MKDLIDDPLVHNDLLPLPNYMCDAESMLRDELEAARTITKAGTDPQVRERERGGGGGGLIWACRPYFHLSGQGRPFHIAGGSLNV